MINFVTATLRDHEMTRRAIRSVVASAKYKAEHLRVLYTVPDETTHDHESTAAWVTSPRRTGTCDHCGRVADDLQACFSGLLFCDDVAACAERYEAQRYVNNLGVQ
jgi:hypothetical protein